MTDLFLETSCVSVNKHDQKLCGDFYLSRKDKNRFLAVLSDGLGSGVKANILATLTAQILTTLLQNKIPLSDCIETVAKTLPVCRERNLAYATFTVLQLDTTQNEAYLAQFDNPTAILLRNGKYFPYPRVRCLIGGKKVDESRLHLENGDVLVMFSDGVANVGLGKTLPDGWPHDDIAKFLEECWTPDVSPQRVAATLAEACVDLALGSPDDDITVVACKVRERQTVNVMIGPPERREDDGAVLADFFSRTGRHAVCGGTTAKRVARYLGEPVTLVEGTGGEVPAMSRIEGVDLVTEGTITLGKTLELAEQYAAGTRVSFGIQNRRDGASALTRLLCEDATDIRFFLGKARNPAHESGDMGIGYAVKARFVRQICALLEQMGKTVEILSR